MQWNAMEKYNAFSSTVRKNIPMDRSGRCQRILKAGHFYIGIIPSSFVELSTMDNKAGEKNSTTKQNAGTQTPCCKSCCKCSPCKVCKEKAWSSEKVYTVQQKSLMEIIKKSRAY